MQNIEKKKELVKEAVKLIKEFKKESEVITEESFSNVRASVNGTKIVISKEYELTEISTVVEEKLRGNGLYSSGLYGDIEYAKSEGKYKLNELSKTEFIKYMGTLCYLEVRAGAIHERLIEIEKVAKHLEE